MSTTDKPSSVRARNKALAINPLKASQPLGATLATLGIRQAIPLLHGSQGCSAFAKVFLVQHFREPIPLQTTAMDQVSTVMGGDDNIGEALLTLCQNQSPALITLCSTGLTETQGSDMARAVRDFRQAHPQFSATRIVTINTPDFKGCLESGYALAVEAMLDALVEPCNEPDCTPVAEQVNVLVSASMTPADIEHIKTTIELFGLTPLVLPDISDSLGHLVDQDFSPLSVGGSAISSFELLHKSAATLVLGRSLKRAGKLLAQRSGVRSIYFDHLMGLQANDAFIHCLQQLSGREVPASIERQRNQLQDAMVDTHFQLGLARVAIAADPELLGALAHWLSEMGAEIVAAVAPTAHAALNSLPCAQIQVGDLQDLRQLATEHQAELLIGNSHLRDCAAELGLPLLRAGFPQLDHYGAHRRCWVGYAGSSQTLFDIANLRLHADQHQIPVYHSILSQKHDSLSQSGCH